jgi:hypothetical protein
MDNVGIVVDDLAAAIAIRRARWRGGAVRGQISALLRPRPRGHHRRAGRAAQLKRGHDVLCGGHVDDHDRHGERVHGGSRAARPCRVRPRGHVERRWRAARWGTRAQASQSRASRVQLNRCAFAAFAINQTTLPHEVACPIVFSCRDASFLRIFTPSSREPSTAGALGRGRRKLERPVSTRRPMHVVLSSKRARGEWSMRKHDRAIKALRAAARRFAVRVYDFANVGTHLHLLVRVRRREGAVLVTIEEIVAPRL